MSDDERTRAIILARHRMFVVTALATVGALGCDPKPQACLEMAPVPVPPPPGASSSEPIPTAEPSASAGAPEACLNYFELRED